MTVDQIQATYVSGTQLTMRISPHLASFSLASHSLRPYSNYNMTLQPVKHTHPEKAGAKLAPKIQLQQQMVQCLFFLNGANPACNTTTPKPHAKCPPSKEMESSNRGGTRGFAGTCTGYGTRQGGKEVMPYMNYGNRYTDDTQRKDVAGTEKDLKQDLRNSQKTTACKLFMEMATEDMEAATEEIDRMEKESLQNILEEKPQAKRQPNHPQKKTQNQKTRCQLTQVTQ